MRDIPALKALGSRSHGGLRHSPIREETALPYSTRLRHSGPAATVGTAFKLISPARALLGVLTVPDDLADVLFERGCAQFVVRHDVAAFSPLTSLSADVVMCSSGALVWSHAWPSRDGVELHGVTVERVEQLRGFSFAPGAGYLRSLIG